MKSNTLLWVSGAENKIQGRLCTKIARKIETK